MVDDAAAPDHAVADYGPRRARDSRRRAMKAWFIVAAFGTALLLQTIYGKPPACEARGGFVNSAGECVEMP